MDPDTLHVFSRICLLLAYAGAILDMASTIGATYYGGVEKHPVWRWVMALWNGKVLFMLGRVLLGVGIVYMNVSAGSSREWYGPLLGILPVLLLFYVSWSNFRIAKRLREIARSEYR